MNIKCFNPNELIEYKNYMQDMLDILTECDKEFVPPLSRRNSTKQTDFNNIKTDSIQSTLTEYFNVILEQHNILVIEDKKVIAFMSYIYDYNKDEFFNKRDEKDINNYITTVCVSKMFRHNGIAQKMYEFVESKISEDSKSSYISTRTWSNNISHTNLLKKRNYQITHVIENDRTLDDGTKVDTVYFGKNI